MFANPAYARRARAEKSRMWLLALAAWSLASLLIAAALKMPH